MSFPDTFPIFKDDLLSHMVLVRKGTFTMGDNKVPIEIEKDFYIGCYLVTQAVWKRVMDDKNPSYFLGDNLPVEQVSWWDICGNINWAETTNEYEKIEPANSFLNKLKNCKDVNPRLGDEKFIGWDFDLPSETQWAYAARGGNVDLRLKYAGSDVLEEVGWYEGNAKGETKRVGEKRSNGLGLFDMSGNVWEWCRDEWEGNYGTNAPEYLKTDKPHLPEKRHANRVMRGGSWGSKSSDCKVANRFYGWPDSRSFGCGFRLVFFPH